MKKVFAAIFILFLFACKKESPETTDTSTSQIISWEDIEAAYVGSFQVPDGNGGGENQNFYYSHAAFCMQNEKTIFLESHIYSHQIRQLNLPETINGAGATAEGEWFDPTNNLLSTGETKNDHYILGGLLMIENRIYFTKHQWYNGGGVDWDSFGYLQKTASFAQGNTYGLWNADNNLAHNLRIGGYMSQAPKSLKSDGVTFLAGQEGLSGDARGRWGPNLFAIKFDDSKPKGAEQEAIPLIVHSKKEEAPEDWWVANRVYSMIWVETPKKQGVLALFIKGYGDTWYGEATKDGKTDYFQTAKGYHSTGRQLVAWIYNPEDLMKVYKGEKAPHTIKPIHKKVLIDLKPGGKLGSEITYSFIKKLGGIRMDMYGNRLIIMQASKDDLPKGYVIDL